MVAVVSGNGLGLTNTSLNTLGSQGAVGNASEGKAGEQVYVNSSNGDLIIQDQDDYLAGLGLDLPLLRTYNSEGQLSDDIGGNWRLGVSERLINLTGTVNTAGSTIVKVFGDESEIVYAYNAAQGKYIATGQAGALDQLTYNATNQQWAWVSGSTESKETYDSTGRLLSARDTDGNTRSYAYTGVLLTQVTDPSGQTVNFDYTGSNLTQIRVVSQGQTQTLTHYVYDSQNRLSQVKVDLSPQDNSISDGNVYTTTYGYDGGSSRITSISRSDGTSVSFTYKLDNGVYRVATYTENAVGPVTVSANDGALTTTQTVTNTTSYNLNVGAVTPQGWSAPTAPPGMAGGKVVASTYDGNGNLFVILNTAMVLRYDAATQTWSTPLALDGSWMSLYSEATVATDSAGNAVLAYSMFDPNTSQMTLYTRRYDPTTHTWSAAQVLDSTPYTDNRLQDRIFESIAAVVNGGHAVITYTNRVVQGLPHSIREVVRYNAGTWGPLERVDDPSLIPAQYQYLFGEPPPLLAMDSSGNVLVMWDEYTSSGWQVLWRRESAESSTWSAIGDLGAGFVKSFAMSANGTALVAFANNNTFSATYNGTTWSTPQAFPASDVGAADPYDQGCANQLAMDATGNGIYAYVSGGAVFARLFSTATGTWGPDQQVGPASESAYSEITAAIAGGHAIVGWQKVDSASSNGIVFRTASLVNGSWTAPVTALTQTAGWQVGLSVDSAGNAFAFPDPDLGAPDATLPVSYSVDNSYLIPAGATWDSVAQALYGVSGGGAALQAFLLNPALTPGARLHNLSATLAVTTSTTSPITPYYTVLTGDTWSSVTQAVYGTTDAAAITALQSALGSTSLTVGAHLIVPTNLSYVSTASGQVTTLNYTRSSGGASPVTTTANSGALSTTSTSNQTYNVNSGSLSTTDSVSQAYSLNTGVLSGSPGTIGFVQGNYAVSSNSDTVTLPFTGAQTAGNLNVVAVGWTAATATVTSVTDSMGNVYTRAGSVTTTGDASMAIYYAKNIAGAAAGANSLTVTFSSPVDWPDIRAAEYQGADQTNPLDGMVGSSGNSQTLDSGSLTTTHASDLLVGASYVENELTGPGGQFTQREMSGGGEILEDQTVSSVGTYDATAPQDSAGWWIMQLAAFKASSSSGSYYTVPSGATWQSIANTLYGVNSAAAGAALQSAMGNPALTAGAHLTGLPATLNVSTTQTVPAYYTIPSGASWQSIANTLYGTNSVAAGTALQTAMGNPALTVGNRLTGLPATLTVSSTVTVPAYYVVPANATWASITQAVYGTSDANAVLALQQATGLPVLSTGLQLVVPLTLSYVPVSSATTVSANSAVLSTTNTGSQVYSLSTGVLSGSPGTISFVQGNTESATTPDTATLSFTGAQTAGNLNVVAVGWTDPTATVTSVTDSMGNVYTRAGSVTTTGLASMAIYYAKNIAGAAAGANTLTVTFSGPVDWPDIRAAEYQGADQTNPLDGMIGSSGNSQTLDSGSLTTTNASDVLVGASYVENELTGPGSQFTQREMSGGGEILEDQTVSSVGSYNATAPQDSAGWWIMQLAAFKAANSSGSYYTVSSGATWQSIANALYGVNSAAAGTALQTALGNPALTTGAHLTGLPATLTVATTQTVPAYYVVPAGASWTSITQAVYGTSDANAVATLQAATGNPALSAGLHLTVPLTLTYSPYASSAQLQTDITDALGQTTTYFSDSSGRLTSILSPTVAGARLRTDYTYDANGNVTTVAQDPSGSDRVTTMNYDANGNLLLTRDALGDTVTRTYSATNRLLTETRYLTPDPDGAGAAQPSNPITTRYAYDSEDHLRFSVSADGRVSEYRYNTQGQLVALLKYPSAAYSVGSLAPTDTVSEAQLSTWAAALDLRQIERTDYAYDFRGNLSTMTIYASADSSGVGIASSAAVTHYVYDQRGLLLQRIDPRASTTSVSGAYATTYVYDGLGRVTSSTQWIDGATSATTLTSYDSANNRTVTTLANGLISTSIYDHAGRLTSLVQSNAAGQALGTTTYSYDADGRLRVTTDPSGVRQYVLYDEAGRRVGDVDGTGTLTQYIYDADSEVVKTVRYADALSSAQLASLLDALGNPTNVSIATLVANLPTTVGRANDQISRAVYDKAGQRQYTIDPNGDVTQYLYDGAGRVTDEVQFATPVTIASSVGALLPSDITVTSNPSDRYTRNFYDNDGDTTGTLDAAGYLVEYTYDGAGQLTQQTAYAKQTNSSLWATGTLAQLRPTADPLNDITSHFFYDGEGRQVGVLDGEGYLSETVYDTAGNVSQQIRYDKARVYIAGATLADLRTLNVPTHTTSFQYDGANRLVQETNYEGTLTTNTYDLVGDLISTTQAAGTSDARTTQERYDSLGRVIAQLSAQGASLISSGMTQGQIEAVWTQYAAHFAYDLLGHKISSTDQNNNATLYFYDSDGRLTYTVNAMGEVTELRYNALGQQTDAIAYYNRISTAFLTGGTPSTALTSRIAAVADPTKDAHTVMTYKLTGQLAGGVTAEGASTTYTYDAFGDELTSVEKIDSTHSLTHQYGYDARGLLTGTIWDPTGLDTTQSESYDAFGRQTSVADSNGNTTHTEYDRLGRQVATVNALDGRTTTTYDAFSRVLTVKDALQNSTSYTYDDTARSVVVTTPEGISATTVHNREGQIFSLTAAGLTTSYSYDANGQLRIVSDNLGTLESRTYDASGRLLNDTDARGAVTTFTYDAANRVFTQTVDSATGGLGLVTTYTFDAEGRTVQVTDPRGKVTSTAYDRDGRVLVVDQDPTGLDVRTTYTYDAAGDVLTAVRGYGSTATSKTQYVYDSLGRRTQEIDDPVSLGGTLNLVTRYKYDANGNVTRKIDANGNSTWFVYDATNRLQYTIDALGGVTGTTYDADSRVLATHRYATPINTSTLGDVVTSVPVTANAAADRVTQSVYDRDGRNVYSIDAAGTVTERQFDANGNVTRVRTYSDQIAPGTYTSIAAVTAALTAVRSDITDIGGNDRVTWTAYDPLGNAAFTVDALGDVVQNTYDAAGDLISTTAYATRRPTGSTDLSSLQSWAQSNANPSLDRTTLYWYDSIGRLRFEQDADGYLHETRYNDAGRTQSTVVYDGRELSLAGSSLSAIALKVQQKVDAHRATTTTYDVLGRVSTVTDANGGVESYTYDALGNKTSFTNQNADTWNYTYDALGRMTNEIDPPVSVTSVSGTTSSLGASTQTGVRLDTAFTYDALGNVLSRTVASGTAQATTTRYAYDALGRQTITYLPAVGVYNPSADSLSRSGTSVVRTETTENLYTEVWYDALGNAYRSLDAAGNYSFKAYDALGRAVYDVDALNYATAYKYDAFGDQTQLTRYANPLTTPLSTTSASVAPGDVAGRISGNAAQDRTITTAYDTLGRVIQVTQPQALNFEANLNSPGGTTFTAGATTITEYDAFGDVVLSRSLVNPLTGTYADTCYYYDHVGNKTAAVDPVGYVTTYTYDESGNVLTQNQYAKALAAGSWNTATFAAPTPTTVFGQPGDPAGYDRDMVYTYDGMSRKTSETLLNFQYYFLNGVLLTEATTNRLTTYAYDAVGNLTQTTTAQKSPGGGSTMDGETLVGATTYSYYDALGRLIAVAQPRRNTDGSLNSNGASRDVELTPLTEMKYDALGNMVEQIQHANDAGVINYVRATPPSVASSSADRVTTILRDAQGRAIQTQDPAGAESFASYDERGNVRKQWQYVTNNDGVTEALVSVNEYDRLGRETDVLQPQRSGSTVVHTMVAYDAFGDIIHKGVYAAGAEGAWQENYDFDQAGRLWRSNSGGEVSKVYLYDLAGNATAQIEDQSVDLGGVSSAGVANSMSGTMRTETVYDLDEHAIQQRQPQFTITDSETLIDAQPVISTIPTPVPPQAIYQQMPIFDAPGMYYYAASPTDWADGGGYEQVAPPSASNPTGTYVQVPQSSYQLVQARQFNWAAPAGIGVVATFQYWSLSSPGNVLTGTVYTVAAGQFGVNISGLASGQYGYTISYSQQGSPSVFATQTGTFNTGTGSVTVASTASPAPVTVTPTTTQAFDRWGNAITVQDSGGGITQYKYNQLSQLTATLLPVTNVVDTRASVDASIARTELRNYYDLQGNLVESQDGNGFSTLETYNSAGQALTRQDSDSAHFAGGAITHNVYSGFGNLIQVTDELGYRTRNVYDNDGRLTLVAQEIQPGSFASAAPTDTTTTTNFSNYVAYTSYSYDQAGRRLTVTDANGYTTRDWYDLQGNVVREETPMIFATTYQYDVRGNKIKATDADNSYQTWTYDANGRLLGHSDLQNSAAYGFGGGTSYVYTYDYAGELKQQTSSVGQNLQYGYDAAGHETSITDTGAATAASGLQNSSSVSTFAYDGTGRQSRQTVIVDNHTQEDTRTGYDALGRIRSLDDPGYQLTYSYDGANNRTVIATTYVDNNLAVQKQTSYYRYNERNEVIISQGVETTGAVPDLTVNASQGVELTYDAKGERISVLTAGTQFQETEVVTNGNVASTTISEVTASNGLGTVNYTYDGLGRLTSIGKASNFTVVNTNTGTSTSSTFNQLFDVRTYDKGGRETSDTTSFLQNGAFSNQEVTSSYDADGNLSGQTTKTNAVTQSSVGYGTATLQSNNIWTGGFDAAGVLRGYTVGVYSTAGNLLYTTTYYNTYTLASSYLENGQTATSSGTQAPGPGATTRDYNVNYALVQTSDVNAPANDRHYANDSSGNILGEIQGQFDGVNGDPTVTQAWTAALSRTSANGTGLPQAEFFYYADSKYVGELQRSSTAFTANFDVNYTPISTQYPGITPTQVVAQARDTPRIIAARVYGDASLWYIVADKNGLTDPNQAIIAGTTLTLPNQVVSLSNTSSSFKPFNVSQALGDTTPTQPSPPAPQQSSSSGGGCGVLGTILLVAVVIIVTVYTAGLTASALGATTDIAAATGATATTASIGTAALTGGLVTASGAPAIGTGIVAAAVGGAVGSIVSQGISILAGDQNGFNWKGVAEGAIGSAVTAGVGGSGLFSGLSTTAVGTSGVLAADAATGSVLSQGIDEHLGLQNTFSWRDVAVAAVAAPLAHAVGTEIDPNFGSPLDTAGFGTQLEANAASGLASVAVQTTIGGQVLTKTVLADAFGNALGNAIVATLQSPDTVGIPRAAANGAFGISNQQMADVNEQLSGQVAQGAAQVNESATDSNAAYLADSNTAVENQRQFVADADQTVQLSARDLNASLARSMRAVSAIPQINFPAEPVDPVVAAEYAARVGPTVDFMAAQANNTAAAGALPAQAVEPVPDQYDDMGQPLHGRSNFNRWSAMADAWESNDSLGDKIAAEWHAFNYVVPDAAQRIAERLGAQDQYSRLDQIEASPLGGTAYAIASIFGADQKTQDLALALASGTEGLLLAATGAGGRAPQFVGAQNMDSFEIKGLQNSVASSPNTAMRDNANVLGTYIDPLTNEVVSATGRLSADHIVPQDWIKAQAGFDTLTTDQQSWVLNHPLNTQGLPQSFNSSKGANLPGEWSTYRGEPLDPGYIQRQTDQGQFIQNFLQAQIDRFNALNGQ